MSNKRNGGWQAPLLVGGAALFVVALVVFKAQDTSVPVPAASPKPRKNTSLAGATNGIPTTGTEAAAAADLPSDESRQAVLVSALLAGNYPASSFDWKRVTYTATDANGQDRDVSLDVAPDYLAVGTDTDKITAPLGLSNAARVASELGFVLPTPLVVETIWKAAKAGGFVYAPSPLPATVDGTMRRPGYWLQHRSNLESQGMPAPGTLVAGNKKDVVVTGKLLSSPGKVAIYGWQDPTTGKPIQQTYLGHGADYADYSHGIRPVNPTIYVDGESKSYADVLRDPVLFAILTRDSAPFDYDRALAGSDRWSMT